MRPFLGQIGHLSVIIAFVAALGSTFLYFRSFNGDRDFVKSARQLFYIHVVAILSTVLCLFTIIFNHYFEYHYAWDNTSLSLPLGYAISCFWQDQEGSFLLWMFWNAVVGIILIRTQKDFEKELIFVFGAIQIFLTSMILGTLIFEGFKIGSNPFLLLKEARPDFPIFSSQPNFVPKDGLGLNPLLQNYWMVIHPPTLFLGFALTQVPFAFGVAALIKNEYKSFVQPAMAWSSVAVVVLGGGIMMGAIWAYETLNFGGYWNWDPVENAVYVPWMVLLAAVHVLLLAKKSKQALVWALILVALQFALILYSTFLARSGILGNASVHSFTDLGLSGQLLIYMLAFIVLFTGLMIYRRKELGHNEGEISAYSREFWIYLGAILLCITAFQVIIPTSYPAFNALGKSMGFNWKLAAPANQAVYYSSWQMWFFAAIAILSGIGQFFWWKGMKKENWIAKLTNPFIISLLISAAGITLMKINDWKYILIFTAAVFGIVSNASILLQVFKGGVKLSGGAFAHIGLALMLLGVLFSEGYKKVLSQNYVGYEVFNNKTENKENIVLWLNKEHVMGDVTLSYAGQYVDVRGVSELVPKDLIAAGEGIKGIAKENFVVNNQTLLKKGDSLKYEAENTYYKVVGKYNNGKTFTLYPRFQENERMGVVFSPAIKKELTGDIYTHITLPAAKEDEKEWSQLEEFKVAMRDTFFINDFVAILDKVEPTTEVPGTALKTGDAAVKATVKILNDGHEVLMHPYFVIKDNMIGRVSDTNKETGIKLQLRNIDPKTGLFTFGVNRTQREFVVLKAIEKPHINLLWLGTALVLFGGILSAIKRFKMQKATVK